MVALAVFLRLVRAVGEHALALRLAARGVVDPARAEEFRLGRVGQPVEVAGCARVRCAGEVRGKM